MIYFILFQCYAESPKPYDAIETIDISWDEITWNVDTSMEISSESLTVIPLSGVKQVNCSISEEIFFIFIILFWMALVATNALTGKMSVSV